MKRIILTAVIWTFLLTLSPGAIRAAEDVDGFRGIRWGTPVSQIRMTKRLILKQDNGKDNYVYYSVDNDNLLYGGVYAASILYFFWRDKFAGVEMLTRGDLDFNALKIAMDETYGLGIIGIGPSGEEIKSWEGEATGVSLWHETATGNGKLVLFSKMMHELKEGLEAEQTTGGPEKGF